MGKKLLNKLTTIINYINNKNKNFNLKVKLKMYKYFFSLISALLLLFFLISNSILND